MNTIRTQTVVQHSELNISFTSNLSRVTDDDSFRLVNLPVGTTDVVVDTDPVYAPSHVAIRLFDGDDVLVGFASSDHPMRLTGKDDSILLRLDVHGRREVTKFVTSRDVNDSLIGKHFFVYDRTQKVAAWFRKADVAASGYFYLDGPATGDIFYVGASQFSYNADPEMITDPLVEFSSPEELAALINDLPEVNASVDIDMAPLMVSITAAVVGPAGDLITISADAGNGGTASASDINLVGGYSTVAPTVSGARLVPVTIASYDTAEDVATAIATAFAADPSFAVVATLNEVVFTDKATGERVSADAGDTTWSAPVQLQTGIASPEIHLKSVGSSQVSVVASPL